jgi:hypothetical protein
MGPFGDCCAASSSSRDNLYYLQPVSMHKDHPAKLGRRDRVAVMFDDYAAGHKPLPH